MEHKPRRANFRLVANMRQVEKLRNFKYMASTYLAEIEKMHVKVIEYLRRYVSEPGPAKAA